MQKVVSREDRNLDLFRAIAVLAVLADHVGIATGLTVNGLAWLGRAGVLAFFVHTSLVLMGTMESLVGMPHWVRTFYVRRAFRIYPLAIVAILLTLAVRMHPMIPVIGAPRAYEPHSSATVGSNLLLVQNLTGHENVLAVLWSLPLELQMYVVLPFCFILARRSVWWVVLIAAAAMIVSPFQETQAFRSAWRLTVIPFVPCFLSGVLVYALWKSRPDLRRAPSWLMPVGVGLAFVVLYVAARNSRVSSGMAWAFCLILGMVITCARELPGSLWTRIAHQIAKYSYGIYLLHAFALWVAFVPFARTPMYVQWAVFAVLLGVLPWVAYHAIEAPLIRVGKRLTHNSVESGSRAAVIGAVEIGAK
ncbi:MAG: acyltransferase family protein [Gemmatimonas sp.]